MSCKPFICPFPKVTLHSFRETKGNNLNNTIVTKAEVIAEISDKTGIEKHDVTTTVEAFFSIVKDTLATGENIYVRGFGSFINKKRAKKVARNISKNTAIIIDEHYIPSFKPAQIFVDRIKENVKS